MAVNRDISRVFSLYSELLLLHRKDERLADLLSSAAYRIRRMDDAITGLDATELASLFQPKIVAVINEIKTLAAIEAIAFF